MQKSDSIKELAKALAGAQGQMEGAKKDSANPFFKSKYADLASVWDACREALSAHGLAVVQSPSVSVIGEPELYVSKSKSGEDKVQAKVATLVNLTTCLVHESGEWIEDTATAVLPFGDPQAVGSAITYLRRYALAAFVGVAPEDDDGEAASGRQGGRISETNRSAVDDAAERWWKKSVVLTHAWAKNNKRWVDLGLDETTIDSLTERGHVGDIARNNLMQKAIGKAPSTPPTTAEYNTASAWLTDLRDGAFKVE